VEIRNSFDLPLPIEEAWKTLLDVPRMAPCMPGARLHEVVDEGRYRGEVAVRLGPVMLTFGGTARIVAQDLAARTVRVVAEGSDAKGRGGARAEVRFSLEPNGGGTHVAILTNLALTGSVAQYGRGAGMINDLANHMIGQFVANLRRELDLPRKADAERPAASAATESPRAVHAVPAEQRAAPIDGGRLGLWLAWRAVSRFFRRIFGAPA
jgi:carbon monoxide dehydrogenase subunit G